jgi:Holliday junction resolvase
MKAPRATELQCEATIIDAAMRAGWRVHGERTVQTSKGSHLTAIKGHRGWPDLVLVRGNQCLVVELKRKPNKVEPDQQAWLDVFKSIEGVTPLVVWVPEQQDEFIRYLSRRA